MCNVVPGLIPMFCNSLCAEGAKAVTIKAWTPKARMLMRYSGWCLRLSECLTILTLFKVYMNYFFRFFCFKISNVLKQIMYLWIKWIMERCYLHLWWYFFCSTYFVFSRDLFAVNYGTLTYFEIDFWRNFTKNFHQHNKGKVRLGY